MKTIKAALLSAAMVAAGTISAIAADPAPPAPANPPQVATNPNLPNSSARLPGPKAGPSTRISSTPSGTPSATTPGQDGGSYYSKKGFGPSPN